MLKEGRRAACFPPLQQEPASDQTALDGYHKCSLSLELLGEQNHIISSEWKVVYDHNPPENTWAGPDTLSGNDFCLQSLYCSDKTLQPKAT